MQDKCIDGKCKKHKKNISQGQSESVLFFAFAFFFFFAFLQVHDILHGRISVM